MISKILLQIYFYTTSQISENLLSMDDSSDGRAVALYPADLGSNPRSGSYENQYL